MSLSLLVYSSENARLQQIGSKPHGQTNGPFRCNGSQNQTISHVPEKETCGDSEGWKAWIGN